MCAPQCLVSQAPQSCSSQHRTGGHSHAAAHRATLRWGQARPVSIPPHTSPSCRSRPLHPAPPRPTSRSPRRRVSSAAPRRRPPQSLTHLSQSLSPPALLRVAERGVWGEARGGGGTSRKRIGRPSYISGGPSRKISGRGDSCHAALEKKENGSPRMSRGCQGWGWGAPMLARPPCSPWRLGALLLGRGAPLGRGSGGCQERSRRLLLLPLRLACSAGGGRLACALGHALGPHLTRQAPRLLGLRGACSTTP